MGHLCFDHMCVVADLVNKVLLGEDLLLCDYSGPADIIQSEEKMVFRGATVPLKAVWAFMVRHVTAVESVKVPLMEEVIVDAYVDRHESQKREREQVAGRDSP